MRERRVFAQNWRIAESKRTYVQNTKEFPEQLQSFIAREQTPTPKRRGDLLKLDIAIDKVSVEELIDFTEQLTEGGFSDLGNWIFIQLETHVYYSMRVGLNDEVLIPGYMPDMGVFSFHWRRFSRTTCDRSFWD